MQKTPTWRDTITHDMAVINEVADRVAVMLHGRVIEVEPTKQIIFNPKHEYTQSLIAAVPRTDIKLERFELVHASAEEGNISTTEQMGQNLLWFEGLKKEQKMKTMLKSMQNHWELTNLLLRLKFMLVEEERLEGLNW